jgi:hypothetical protein
MSRRASAAAVRDRAACSALQALEVADGAEQLDEVIAPARLAQ